MFLLTYLIDKLSSAFEPTSYRDELTRFVESNHPSTVADVEYWIDQYDRRQQRKPSGMFGYQ